MGELGCEQALVVSLSSFPSSTSPFIHPYQDHPSQSLSGFLQTPDIAVSFVWLCAVVLLLCRQIRNISDSINMFAHGELILA